MLETPQNSVSCAHTVPPKHAAQWTSLNSRWNALFVWTLFWSGKGKLTVCMKAEIVQFVHCGWSFPLLSVWLLSWTGFQHSSLENVKFKIYVNKTFWKLFFTQATLFENETSRKWDFRWVSRVFEGEIRVSFAQIQSVSYVRVSCWVFPGRSQKVYHHKYQHN